MKKSNIFSVDLQNRKRGNPKPPNVLHLVPARPAASPTSLGFILYVRWKTVHLKIFGFKQLLLTDQVKPLDAFRANLALARPAHSHSLPFSTTSLVPKKNKKLGHEVCYGVPYLFKWVAKETT